MSYILQGFRACIFAFGITGSGKSYTVLGDEEPSEKGSKSWAKEGQAESQGLLQRTIQHLFNQGLENFSVTMQAGR